MSLVFFYIFFGRLLFLSKRKKNVYSCQPTRNSLCLEFDTLKGKRTKIPFSFSFLANSDLPGLCFCFPSASGCVCVASFRF